MPSVRVIGCAALCVLKQYQGLPRRQARQLPQTARQFSTTKSPGATSVTPVAHLFHDARGLVPEQEGEVVADAALAVVQVGVAHAARLHPDHGLAGPGIGNDDGGDLDRRALCGGNHAADFLWHGALLVRGGRFLRPVRWAGSSGRFLRPVRWAGSSGRSGRFAGLVRARAGSSGWFVGLVRWAGARIRSLRLVPGSGTYQA